jgi:type VI secretion system protein
MANPPSLYEILLQNFDGELDLQRVNEEDQAILSVLDNLQRILNSRAGTLDHLPDYGLPDMGLILQGLPATAQELIELLPQVLPGHLDYALDLQLKGGARVAFGTTLAPEGKVLVRHLKRQQSLV